MILFDGPAAAEERHQEDDAADHNQENGSVEKLEKIKFSFD